jgi:hypothetical protein
MLSGISGLTGRPLAWLRRHRRLGVALLSTLVLIGVVPLLAYAVTFSKATTFIGAVTLTVPLAVASGGTGVTTSTGTGNVVLSASPTFTGTLTAAALTASGAVTFSGLSAIGTPEAGLHLCLSGTTVKYSTVGNCDTTNGDIAEKYGTEEPVVRGEIVALGATVTSRQFYVKNPDPGEATQTKYTITTSNVRKATFATRSRLIGAVPTTPQVLGQDVIDPNDHPQLVALVGHVPVKMTLDGGNVAIGDPITVSSSTPGYGMKAVTSGRILGWALEDFSATSTSLDGMIEVYIKPQDWIAPQDFDALLDLSQLSAASTDSTGSPQADTSFTTRFFSSLFVRLTAWLADATNGIHNFYASIVHSDRVETKELCVGSTCVTEDQFKATVARSAAAGN